MRLSGRFGAYGGAYVPEILVPAVEQLEAAFLDASEDPAFRAELDDLLAKYAGRPTPLTRCRNLGNRAGADLSEARGPSPRRRPQDQSGARPGPARAEDGQDPADRGDRCRPARRRHRLGRCPVRAEDPNLHGRPRRRAAEAQRLPDGADGRRGGAGRERVADPQGRDQRGAEGLGGELRGHPLSARHRRRPASLPADGPRISAGHRQGGAGADTGGGGPAPRRLHRRGRRRLQRHRAIRRLHRRSRTFG